MEFTIDTKAFSRALKHAYNVVGKKMMPSLANILIQSVSKDQIRISAIDLEVALTADHPATVTVQGAMSLNAKSLYEVVKALPSEQVTLKGRDNHWVDVVCGKAEYRIVGMAPEEFPALPQYDNVPFFAIEPKTFREMIDKTLYAVSPDETRFNLTGVCCQPFHGAGLRMVATDGHRLSLVDRPLQATPSIPAAGAILPKKGLVVLSHLLDEKTAGRARLGFVENSAVFERGGLTLLMRLIDGTFPDYEQVIPKEGQKRVGAKRTALVAALRRVSVNAVDKRTPIVMLYVSRGTLRITANNPDLGEAREDIDVVYDGEPLQIGFNARYLLDALSVLTEEDVVLELSDELSPGLIKGKGSEGHVSVIMPAHI